MQDHPNGHIFALDEMSLYFQATLTRVWAPIGQTPVVRMTPQRDCAHFYGALELRTGREIALTAPQQTSQMTANFLCILLTLFPTQSILLLLDRASWHFGAVSKIVNDNDRLQLMYFPPACPDLNPQEHVWAQARENISHNHNYTNFQRLIDDFEIYLNETPFETNFMQRYAPPTLCEF